MATDAPFAAVARDRRRRAYKPFSQRKRLLSHMWLHEPKPPRPSRHWGSCEDSKRDERQLVSALWITDGSGITARATGPIVGERSRNPYISARPVAT